MLGLYFLSLGRGSLTLLYVTGRATKYSENNNNGTNLQHRCRVYSGTMSTPDSVFNPHYSHISYLWETQLTSLIVKPPGLADVLKHRRLCGSYPSTFFGFDVSHQFQMIIFQTKTKTFTVDNELQALLSSRLNSATVLLPKYWLYHSSRTLCGFPRGIFCCPAATWINTRICYVWSCIWHCTEI